MPIMSSIFLCFFLVFEYILSTFPFVSRFLFLQNIRDVNDGDSSSMMYTYHQSHGPYGKVVIPRSVVSGLCLSSVECPPWLGGVCGLNITHFKTCFCDVYTGY